MTNILRHCNTMLRLCFLVVAAAMTCSFCAYGHEDADVCISGSMYVRHELCADTLCPDVSQLDSLQSDTLRSDVSQLDSLLSDTSGEDSVATTIDTVLATVIQQTDSIEAEVAQTADSVSRSVGVQFSMPLDTIANVAYPVDKGRFIPDPKKALWLAMVIPGGGQIYNRKYWKLPLIYGGFIGCVYAMTWNNTMFRDYSQAYIDIMDNDENTKSYENFLPDHYDVKANEERLKDLFRRKKNFYRRYRDLSMFCMIGVYALSILDAYIDAEMSSFDISDDLTLKVRPAVINDRHTTMRTPKFGTTAYGIGCSLSF